MSLVKSLIFNLKSLFKTLPMTIPLSSPLEKTKVLPTPLRAVALSLVAVLVAGAAL